MNSIAVDVSPACFYFWRAFVNMELLRLHWRVSTRFHIYAWESCVHLWRAHTFSRSTHSSSTSPCSLCLVFSRLEHLACVASAASSASCRRASSFFLQWTLVTNMLVNLTSSTEEQSGPRCSKEIWLDFGYWIGSNLENVSFKRKWSFGFDLEQTFSMCCSKHFRLGSIWFSKSQQKSRFRVDFM